MIKRKLFLIATLFFSQQLTAQTGSQAQHWADSVYKKLSKDERIAQLMVVRLSSIDAKTKTVTFYTDKVAGLIKKYNIGSLCLFQGSPVKQANILNSLQAMAKTPLLICIDAEWGLGMRMIDSVMPLPKQMMLGAMTDGSIVYRYGQIVAAQCKRMNIQVNYAPVVDVNNNPNNPVINDRSFGEDKYKVAAFGIQYMKGMQDAGVMACAKHFPGHGDVTADSHFDLPVINKSMAQLDSLELYPFRQIFAAGIASVMVAHLYIPAIDAMANRATSLSPKNINELMRSELNYPGLTFTDALEMQGVKKFFPDGEAAVQSLIAGNDMLCLPDDVPAAIKKIKDAIKKKKLSWNDIEQHCKKALAAKYAYGLASLKPINTDNLTADLNADIPAMKRLVAENAITLTAKTDPEFFPLRDNRAGDVAYVGFGISNDNAFAKRMRADYNADVFYFGNNDKYDAGLFKKLKGYKKIIVGIHNLSRFPANNFGLTANMKDMINAIQQNSHTISFLFANAYALKNMCTAENMVVCYEDDAIIQNTAADLLQGKIFYKGVLPVTVCENLKYGFGLLTQAEKPMFEKDSSIVNAEKFMAIDSIAKDAIAHHATPGCVVLALKDGRIIYEKAFGQFTYEDSTALQTSAVYDLASLTKIFATTLAVMKLYENGSLDLKKKLRDYLPETIGTDKQDISIEQLLLHEAGLEAFIPFYKETLDGAGRPSQRWYSTISADSFSIPVAENLFIRTDFKDSVYARILTSRRSKVNRYLYSDNDYIFLGKVIERITGKNISDYVAENFYEPMGLHTIGYDPFLRNDRAAIAPTEREHNFRMQLLRGYVHDPGAAIMGGIAGHAGLFSNAYDLAAIMQMLLNGGEFKSKAYLKKATIDLFTSYQSYISRRGLGFDKPEKDNATAKQPYPSKYASPATFGHTGFTGTCAWADPAAGLVYIFLSNRVYPSGSNTLLNMNIRGKIFDSLYHAFEPAGG